MEVIVKKGSIYYEIIGSGHPILILHAMGTDHRAMKAFLEPIFEKRWGFKRIYIDIPAHGKSKISEDFVSTDDMLLNILDFVNQVLPHQEFSIVGTSYGGYIAQGILHQMNNLINGICLIAPALHTKIRSLPHRVVFERDEDSLVELDFEIRKAFETLMTVQSKENLSYFLEEIQPGRALANRTFLTSNWRESGYYLSEEPFHNIEVLRQPSLFLLGKQDSICGYKDHFKLLEQFPNSTFSILDKAGHMLQIEKRHVARELISDWLNKIQ